MCSYHKKNIIWVDRFFNVRLLSLWTKKKLFYRILHMNIILLLPNEFYRFCLLPWYIYGNKYNDRYG